MAVAVAVVVPGRVRIRPIQAMKPVRRVIPVPVPVSVPVQPQRHLPRVEPDRRRLLRRLEEEAEAAHAVGLALAAAVVVVVAAAVSRLQSTTKRSSS